MSTSQRQELRTAFGSFLSGVTVVTAADELGNPVGFTANSFSSVSLDPPLLLVCPARTLSSFGAFWACTHFAVSILAEQQQDVSNLFATSSVTNEDRFAQVEWHHDSLGSPLIADAAAHFSCRSHSRMEAGDHLILIGQIEAFDYVRVAGLGYSNQGYFGLGMERRAESFDRSSTRTVVGAIIERDGEILLEQTDKGWRPPQIEVSARGGALSSLATHVSRSGVDVEFGPVYSIYDSGNGNETFTYYRGVALSGGGGELGTYVSLEESEQLDFVTRSQASMIRRYVLERRNGVFGLYVGDDHSGEVHLLGQGPAV